MNVNEVMGIYRCPYHACRNAPGYTDWEKVSAHLTMHIDTDHDAWMGNVGYRAYVINEAELP